MDLSRAQLIAMARLIFLLPFGVGLIGFASLALPRLRQSRLLGPILGWATTIISLGLLLLSLAMALAPAGEYPLKFAFGVRDIKLNCHIDSLSLYFILLVNLIALFASWNALHSATDEPEPGSHSALQHPGFFQASINLFHSTMLFVPMVDNLVGLWIAIEATTLVSALLVGFHNNRDSWEAAWKYLIITSTGIILALLGTMFLANAVSSTIKLAPGGQLPDNIMDWTVLRDLAGAGTLADSKDFVKLSFLFILIGYGTKAGFAPMHTWLPDGHGEAPAPISALLSGVLLKSALYAILRYYTITNAVLGDSVFTSALLLGTGLLSLLVATPFILKENRFKRVLAYHSLEHMGIITFGIGIGGEIAIFGALLHVLNHAVTKSLMFLSFGNIMRQYEALARRLGRPFDQNSIRGVMRTMPVTGSIMTLGGLALVGAPPFNIFLSEFLILWGAFKRLGEPLSTARVTNPTILVAISLFMVSTTLIFYGLVRHLAKIVLARGEHEDRLEEKTLVDLAPLGLLLLIALAFGVGLIGPISGLLANSVTIVLNLPG